MNDRRPLDFALLIILGLALWVLLVYGFVTFFSAPVHQVAETLT
jgi:hypothetical protein